MVEKMPVSEAQRRAREKYDAEHRVRVSFALNRGTEDDIIDKLSKVPNKNGYIKALIRADIAREE